LSSILIAGNTSGTITLDAPNVAGTTVLTLPTANGTVLTTGSTGQVINKASLPTGSVLQVVNATYSTQSSTSSGAFVDTSLTATITPTSNTSKILVFVSQTGLYKAGTNSYIILRLVRGATSIVEIEKEFLVTGSTGTSTGATSTTYLDSPATTSATTYKTQIALGGVAGTIYWNVTSCTSTITLMEIAA
jgi:hypothetical protein